MKKLIVMLALVVAGATAANAQSPVLKSGDLIGNIGLSALNGGTLGVNASLEYGLTDHLLGVNWLGWGWGGSLDAIFYNGGVVVAPAVRTALHLNLPVNGLDLYIGACAGYGVALGDYTGGGFYWGFYGGIRYFFTNSLGIYAEGGYPVGGRIGLTFRF